MATAGSSPTPQWDSRNRGFIPPSQLQRLRQSSPLAREFVSPERPRSMATDSFPSPTTTLRPSPTSASTHTRSSSFFSFLRSNDNPPSTMPSRTAEPGPRHQPSSDEIGRLPMDTRRPPMPSTSTLERSPSLPVQGPMQLHQEIRSVVTLTHAHAHKVYMSGPLVRRIERLPDGHHPTKDEGWRDVWAQLGGTTLSIWDMKEIDEASRQGKEVPPTYINVTDAFVNVLGAVTIPASGGIPAQKYVNVVTVNTAGSNLLLFSCPNAASLISWATAFRLAAWEKSRLEEIYTAHLIRITLNDGRTAPSTLVRGRREGWVRVRIAGQTDWKHLWMAVTSGSVRETSGGPPQPGTPPEQPQHKRRISSLFGRDNSQSQPPSAQPIIAFYTSPKPKDRRRPFLTMRDVTQAFAVYPERPELINKSTLMKIEGKIGDEEVAMAMRKREGWILVMPELETGVPQANETIRWLIAFHDAFSLYGRPRAYSWDPRDESSMMYAYPVGPARDSLFLERETAETMDPRNDRTSVVRSSLLSILSLRIQAPSPPSANSKLSNPNVPPTFTSLSSTEGPATGIPQDGTTSRPRLPSLGFGSSGSESQRRALTPIVEGSGHERDPSRLPVSEATMTNSDNNTSGPQAQHEEAKAPSPAQVSPPSTYPPTEATSAPVSPPYEPEIEKSSINASTGKPSPEIVTAAISRGSSERPTVNDDNRVKDVCTSPPASARSLHSSAASPPPLSPANSSSNPTASVSPVQGPPRTPSPRLSILTSPHSMSESPRPNQSFAEVAESLGSQPLTSPTIVHAVPLQPSKLSQDSVQTSTDSSPDGAQGLFDEAGALYFIHQLEQGSPDANPLPEPGMNGQNGSLKSEISPYSQFVQPTVAPLRPKSASPPPRPASSGRSLPPLDVSHRKPPIQQLPRTPTLDYGPERRPAGARAAPVSNRQDSASSSAQPPLPNGNIRQGRMSQFEDPDADAFAALTYLERDNENNLDTPAPAPKPSTSSPAVPPPFHPREEPPSIVEPDERAPSPESENASVYKSSFAPSKNAMQRKARTEAQQAAHDAAAHRPGRGTAKAKNKANTVGAWGDSSEEEEEEEEDEDEDVDSDGQPVVARDDRSVSNYAASLNQRSTPRGPSPLPSGGDAPLPPPPRPPRNLPPVPVLRGQVHDGDSLGPRHMDQYEAGRRSYHEDGVSHGGAAPQGPIPTHAPAPIPPRHMWSQVLDPGHNAGAVPETNPRGTFVQLDAPEQTMTKAFTPHGLLSAGLQDKEDRSAKRQEELARETGASLINVPNKPPPPQTGLLGAITAHERDRKREGGVGAALTEREREKRLAEERQRKLDDYQRQQLEQMQQGGSMYGQQLAGYPMMNSMNPMNPMMMGMGMNSMMPNFMGYPGMVPGFGNPQHMFAAQQAAQAYQQAMYSLSQAGSQIGGDGGAPVPLSPIMTGARLGPSPTPMHPMITGGGMTSASPAPLNPMMTGGGMSVGAFDPRYSMMNMSMMNPMANPMAMGMGMGNPGMMGAPMGMGMPMNNGAGFDPRMSQFDPGLQVPNSNFVQAGRAGSSLGLDPSPGAGDGARRSSSASPRPPQ